MILTDLQIIVLGRIVRGEDPWGGPIKHSGTVSQTVQRLIRKGAVKRGQGGRTGYHATDEGKAYLAGKVPASPA